MFDVRITVRALLQISIVKLATKYINRHLEYNIINVCVFEQSASLAAQLCMPHH